MAYIIVLLSVITSGYYVVNYELTKTDQSTDIVLEDLVDKPMVKDLVIDTHQYKKIHKPNKTKNIIKTIKKPKKPISGLKFISVAKIGANFIALVNDGKRSFVLIVGDLYKGKPVLSITEKLISIDGYLDTKKPKSNNKRIRQFLSQTTTPNQPLEESTPASESFNIKTKNSSQGMRDIKLAIAKKKKPPKERHFIKHLVQDVIDNPMSLTDIVSFTKTSDGYRIIPKRKYRPLFNKAGLKDGDVVIKINNTSVNSPKIFVDMMLIGSSKSVRLLVLNNSRYRIVNLNLMDTYRL